MINKVVWVYIYMIKISGKMDESDTYNELNSNISIFVQEFLQTKHFFEFFYIQANEEIDKITEKFIYVVHSIGFQTFLYRHLKLS